jgi:hypothetical protein
VSRRSSNLSLDPEIREELDTRAAGFAVKPSILVEALGRALIAGDVQKLDEHVDAARNGVKAGQRARLDVARASPAREEGYRRAVEEGRVGGKGGRPRKRRLP